MLSKLNLKQGAVVALSTLTILSSCQKTPVSDQKQSPAYSKRDNKADINFLTIDEARTVAEYITPETFRGKHGTGTTRAVVSSYDIKDRTGTPALYVFNYGSNNGYVILSADLRYEPICAFADYGSISPQERLPSTLTGWFEHTVDMIQSIRDNSWTEDITENQVAWVKMAASLNMEYLPPNLGMLFTGQLMTMCDPYHYFVKDSLLNNQWDQGCTYNNLIPVTGCTAAISIYCGHAPTGCVATVGAIIAHYWGGPSGTLNYNYSIMPRNTGNYEVQRLMLNIGQIIDIDWECVASDGSGGSAGETEDLTNFFQNYLYYTASGDYDSYNGSSHSVIKEDIDNNRPVILDGKNGGRGHTWLCDGYRVTTSNCFPGRFHFHMNWGWGGYKNGFYYQSNSWPPGKEYTDSRRFLHNIHP